MSFGRFLSQPTVKWLELAEVREMEPDVSPI